MKTKLTIGQLAYIVSGDDTHQVKIEDIGLDNYHQPTIYVRTTCELKISYTAWESMVYTTWQEASEALIRQWRDKARTLNSDADVLAEELAYQAEQAAEAMDWRR